MVKKETTASFVVGEAKLSHPRRIPKKRSEIDEPTSISLTLAVLVTLVLLAYVKPGLGIVLHVFCFLGAFAATVSLSFGGRERKDQTSQHLDVTEDGSRDLLEMICCGTGALLLFGLLLPLPVALGLVLLHLHRMPSRKSHIALVVVALLLVFTGGFWGLPNYLSLAIAT